jgi:hypothetical protein
MLWTEITIERLECSALDNPSGVCLRSLCSESIDSEDNWLKCGKCVASIDPGKAFVFKPSKVDRHNDVAGIDGISWIKWLSSPHKADIEVGCSGLRGLLPFRRTSNRCQGFDKACQFTGCWGHPDLHHSICTIAARTGIAASLTHHSNYPPTFRRFTRFSLTPWLQSYPWSFWRPHPAAE